ncbi:MAG TPA: ATP-binding protein, partial [Isosphaeraceae bacterium]|nr:ATP-binding protein [Isosphaeraceae bacterium]
GASKIARDITEHKRTEQERKEADRRKDEFLAMLAHELRNPIAAISNAVRFFGMSGPGMEQDLQWSKGVMERQVKHLTRLIDDLLDVSRITRGKIQLRKDRLDAGPILNSAVEDVQPLIEERKHELTVSFVPGTLGLNADATRVHQILVNLLVNAAKYTDAGGKIWLTARREGDQVVIKVRDNGMGIPPDRLPTMFELFAQGERSLARSEGGLGVGLALVKKLVEMHGGTVSAASEGPGKGSEFTIQLPAVERALGATAQSTPGHAPDRVKGSRVLVVDDNIDTATGLAKLLKVLGHDVRTAHDGQAAIEAAREHRPEFVLLDLGLPRMDGYQVAEKLRQEECCKGAVLIAISGYGQEQDRRRSTQSGFHHHLVKPLDYSVLLTLMERPN